MKTTKFLKEIEAERLLQAIRLAEKYSSSDVVVLISQKTHADILAAGREAFDRLELEKALHRNSLLIFVAPLSQSFAVIGGSALHEKAGQEFWEKLASILGSHFKEGKFSQGLVAAVNEAAAVLKKHFPAFPTQNRQGQVDLIDE